MPPQRSVNAPQVRSRARAAHHDYDVSLNMVSNDVTDVVINTKNLFLSLHVNARAPNILVSKRRLLFIIIIINRCGWSQRCFYLREFAAAPPRRREDPAGDIIKHVPSVRRCVELLRPNVKR